MNVFEIFVVVGTLILPQSSGLCLINDGAQYRRHHPSPSSKDRYSKSESYSYAVNDPIPRNFALWAIAENRITSESCTAGGINEVDAGIINDRGHEHVVVGYDQFSQTCGEEGCSYAFASNGKSKMHENELDNSTESERKEDLRCAEGTLSYDDSGKQSDTRAERSTRAKTLVDKSKKGGEDKGVGAVGIVLDTVRIAAAASLLGSGQIKLLENEFGCKWKSAVHSTVTDMLRSQDARIQQQSLEPPPPGTTSMGVLGEVVQELLPNIPPCPGTVLVGAIGNRDESTLIVRSSIPQSSDDTHIANLRLSVFSQFDKEQQRIFRYRSVEVLNIRRRKGAVVLVVERTQGQNSRDQPYLNEMYCRIEKGYEYESRSSPTYTAQSLLDILTPTLTVRPGQGVMITSVSSGVDVGVAPDPPNGEGLIIGSVECSYQEFRGTMLGNSRPTGSLMYVTEVAVRANSRRCGAGVMLLKGVDEVAVLRNVETIYLHVDVTNKAACAMYEKCGYHYLDKRLPIYAQFTASLNLHDGATHGRSHYLMGKNLVGRTTWLEDNESDWNCFADNC